MTLEGVKNTREHDDSSPTLPVAWDKGPTLSGTSGGLGDGRKYGGRRSQLKTLKRQASQSGRFLSNVPEVDSGIEYRMTIVLVGADANLVAKTVCASEEANDLMRDAQQPKLRGGIAEEETLPNCVNEEQRPHGSSASSARIACTDFSSNRSVMSVGSMMSVESPSPPGTDNSIHSYSTESIASQKDNLATRVTSAQSLLAEDDRCICRVHVNGQSRLVRLELKAITSSMDSVPVPKSRMEAESTAVVFVLRESDGITLDLQLEKLDGFGLEFKCRARAPYGFRPFTTLLHCTDDARSRRPAVSAFLQGLSIDNEKVQVVPYSMRHVYHAVCEVVRHTLEANVGSVKDLSVVEQKPEKHTTKRRSDFWERVHGMFPSEGGSKVIAISDEGSSKRSSLRNVVPNFTEFKKRLSVGTSSKRTSLSSPKFSLPPWSSKVTAFKDKIWWRANKQETPVMTVFFKDVDEKGVRPQA